MTGNKFLCAFYDSLNKKKRYPDGQSYERWTRWMLNRLEETAKKLKCYPVVKNKRRRDSGEYMGMDVTMFQSRDWQPWKKRKLLKNTKEYDPFVLPVAVVEHDNNYDTDYIGYCLWKLCCHRSRMRVLISYQPKRRVNDLIHKLTAIVKFGRLVHRDSGALLVVVGREGVPRSTSWEDYYWAFRWTSQRFRREKVKSK